jgi:ADP-ribose pyrophosphatase
MTITPDPGGFTKLGERPIHRGHVIEVAVGEFRGPDGSVFTRDLVHHPGAVSVVALLDDASVVFVRQYRAALDQWLLEIPAGKRDVAHEPPELTAGRELREEVGLVAGSLELLARFHNSPGFCDEESWVFLATDLTSVPASVQGVEEESMTLEHHRLDQVPQLIASGQLTDAKSIIGCTLALHRLAR